jgi:hypothetical protein
MILIDGRQLSLGNLCSTQAITLHGILFDELYDNVLLLYMLLCGAF